MLLKRLAPTPFPAPRGRTASGLSSFPEATMKDTTAMVEKLTAYAATLPADAKKPVERAIGRLNNRLLIKARVARETMAWLRKQT